MTLRETHWERLDREAWDVLVVGGGINGAVSAAALTACGAKVALVDRGDFAGGTSMQSSNLAWGGIKYLESYEFGLVLKLCASRNELMRRYPSAVREIRFFATHERRFRHKLWTLVAGTWLYWFMGGLFTRRPRLLTRKVIAAEEPVVAQDRIDGGFEYSDAYLPDNDARFVFGFIQGALASGATTVNYAEVTGAERVDGRWQVSVRDVTTGRTKRLSAKVLVNAAGPWADGLNARAGVATGHRHVLSKGIHLIVDRVTPSERVLTFFADDGRLFFVIPMGAKTCIGTTDTWVEQPEVGVTPEDRRFVLDNVNKRLRLEKPLTEADVIAERCGVRPLVVTKGPEGGGGRDWMHLSRKHALEVKDGQLSIFGGKLTDCLNVGDEVCRVVRRLGVELPRPKAVWFGEPERAEREAYFAKAKAMGLDTLCPGSSEPLSERLWRRYGREAFAMLESIARDRSMADRLVEGADDVRCEFLHAARAEMVVRLDDYLRRRSRLSLLVRRETLRHSAGLREAARILFGDEGDARLAEYFSEAGDRAA
ncbi:MAG: Family ership [Pseudomonadota bacterium]|jgi:glycerol-3-phosphate dehydrogenase